MANTKEYKIVINGITESVNAVKSLEKELFNLEQKIKELESRSVNVRTTGTGGGGAGRSNAAILNEEEAVQREINKLKQQGAQLDAKREAAMSEEYQKVQAIKDLYKETVNDQKALAAAERLQADAYSNTMQGMKQQLADLKAVINTTDLGDGDQLKKMTEQANELNKKLLEIEKSYGQFGRNVGNYESAADGLNKLVIAVGGVDREFSSAREASKTLKNELYALEIQGKGNTDEANELRKAFYRLQSAMDDATKSSKAMDEAMDWMESFTAMAGIGNGLKAFFGFDDNEITRSIQKLVSLQNVLKGLETIRKQMETGEGIGKILTEGNDAVDKFVAGLTGAEITVKGLAKNSRLATIAVRSLSVALKSIGIGVITVALGKLLSIIEDAGSAIQDYFKGNADLIDTSHAITSSIEAENNAIAKQRQLLSTNHLKGYIDDVNYSIQQYMVTLNQFSNMWLDLTRRANLLKDELEGFRQTLTEGFGNGVKINFGFGDFFTKDVPVFIKDIEGAKEAWEDFYRAVSKGEDILSDGHSDTIAKWLWSFVATAEDAKDTLVSIGQTIAGDWARRVLEIETYSGRGKKEIQKLVDELNNDKVTRSVLMNLDKYFDDEEIIKKLQNVIKYVQELNQAFQFEDEIGKGYEYYEQVRIDAMKNGAAKIRRQIKLNHDKEIAELDKYGQLTDKHRAEIDAKYRRQEQDQLKAISQQQQQAQNDLNKMRIDLMKEGLDKQLAQLEQEKKEKIQAIVRSEILVGERTKAVNELYAKKMEDERKKWAAEMLKIYEDLYANIESINRATYNMEWDTASSNVESKKLNIKQEIGYDFINKDTFDNSKVLEQYYEKVLELEKHALDREKEIKQERLNVNREFDEDEEKLRHKRLVEENGEYQKQLELGKITQEQYNQLIESENAAHSARMNAIAKEYAANSKATLDEQLQQEQALYNNYFSNIIGDVKKDKQKIDEIMAKQPETDTEGWDVVLAIKVKKTYRTVITQYENLKNDIIKKQKDLEIALKNGRISPEDFAMRQAELKQELNAIGEAVKDVTEKQKLLVSDFIQSIQQYIDAAVGSFNQIMNAVWDAQDVANDKEQEQLEKANEILEKQLDKQQEIVEQHKSKIDSIEDELSTARGDRRQHLIDQLNAEMAAQREAQAQEKKIQKEKEANERKQDELEKKRKKQQYHRDMLQAVVNGAMAVTYALVNKWPIPALPMAALAASTAAAQIGIMAANKPYAKGGLLEGPSHAQGGIPVGNTGIEVEGKEYVIRKSSTAPNIEILDYINKSQRKLDLDDFIEFYSSGKVRKTITSMSPRSRFADGGTIPTLSTSIDINDRLLSAFEDYSNRPVYVSVQDINSRQKAVKDVQVLAGLTE